MTATTERCPGCHGTGTEPSGTTHAGIAEHLACGECGPDCAADCGCRVDDAAEHPEFVAGDGLGATQSPDGSPSASDVRSSLPARDAVTDAEAAQWAALADAATEGPWAIMGGGEYVSGIGTLVGVECAGGVRDVDAAFVAAARTAVPRLLADRKRLMDALADEIAQRNMDRSALLSFQDRQTITTRALDTACGVLQEASGLPDDIDDPDCRDEMVLALRPRAEKAEAENARLREGIEALAAEMEADETPPDEERYVLDDYANALRALLAEGGE